MISDSLAVAEPKLRHWSRSEFYHLSDLGWFQGQRAQLIEGEVVVMSPQKFPHYACIDRVVTVLTDVFGNDCWVRSQAPLALSEFSEPEPDVSVVAGSRDDYADHPSTALMVVEVSDSSLAFDRTRKAALYARAGIGDYWIINLLDRQIEVHRGPQSEGHETSASGYSSVPIHRAHKTVSPLDRPDASITVAELLP